MSDTQQIDEHALLEALNARQVVCAFQPVVDARNFDVHHYECLLRVMETEYDQPLPPGPFIAAAEELGLIHLLDRRMLENAARALIGRGDLRLALNVSAQTVANRRAADDYLDALRALGPAASRLTLELTETVAVDDPTLAARFSTRARAMGCKFAVDDFGSGYTTFRNLLAIEADSIKIDGSFIEDLLTEERARTFIRMIVDLAQTFGVDTVAERVETAEEAAMLSQLGVDFLQGYHFGVPSLKRPAKAA